MLAGGIFGMATNFATTLSAANLVSIAIVVAITVLTTVGIIVILWEWALFVVYLNVLAQFAFVSVRANAHLHVPINHA